MTCSTTQEAFENKIFDAIENSEGGTFGKNPNTTSLKCSIIGSSTVGSMGRGSRAGHWARRETKVQCPARESAAHSTDSTPI